MPGVKNWIAKAAADLKVAVRIMDDPETFDYAVFHTHQCAEKSFKAFLIFKHQPIPKTHSLNLLLIACSKFDSEFAILSREIAILDPYGNDSRYPNDFFYVNQSNVNEAINIAKKILDFVKKKCVKKDEKKHE